jgi:hypothetical protein
MGPTYQIDIRFGFPVKNYINTLRYNEVRALFREIFKVFWNFLAWNQQISSKYLPRILDILRRLRTCSDWPIYLCVVYTQITYGQYPTLKRLIFRFLWSFLDFSILNFQFFWFVVGGVWVVPYLYGISCWCVFVGFCPLHTLILAVFCSFWPF